MVPKTRFVFLVVLVAFAAFVSSWSGYGLDPALESSVPKQPGVPTGTDIVVSTRTISTLSTRTGSGTASGTSVPETSAPETSAPEAPAGTDIVVSTRTIFTMSTRTGAGTSVPDTSSAPKTSASKSPSHGSTALSSPTSTPTSSPPSQSTPSTSKPSPSSGLSKSARMGLAAGILCGTLFLLFLLVLVGMSCKRWARKKQLGVRVRHEGLSELDGESKMTELDGRWFGELETNANRVELPEKTREDAL